MRRFRVPIVIALAAVLVLGILRTFAWAYVLHDPIVIGHRGSAYGVENTTQAIEGAVDAGAQYAEIDILLSADGVPMVVHDTNLSRLSGENVNVYDLTAEELSRLVLYQNGYTGEISTLEEIVDFCRGKIKLAIELKSHGHETVNLVDAILDVLREEDFLKDCMFLSMEHSYITEINQKSPDSHAGFCVYGNVGNIDPSIVDTMEIDFIVIEEAMATRSIVQGFQGAWIPVYVWTVNDPRNMQKYLEMGIIGLVTDEPYDGVNVMREYLDTHKIRILPEDEQVPL